MEINNKYNIGDELYTVVRKPIKYDCPVCDGSGVFQHNGYTVRCPHCCGSGKLHDRKTLWSVANEKVTIRRIIASIWNDQITCKYKVNYSGGDCNINNRGEDNLYWNKEDAEAWCLENNNPIHDIKTDETIHTESSRKPCRVDDEFFNKDKIFYYEKSPIDNELVWVYETPTSERFILGCHVCKIIDCKDIKTQ